ncbi:hypothetical protein TSAR_002401 [Trichomalopsis sarcophagae]|uniref:Cytochrome P450 n=1 Tax=Trichomalopsis sarcophagae TaxID=543379 RepID=A0A232EQV5_9HYME|nr:hypothetical protein TSAR_002401 [Trichomalopsis sarcophagae]
MTIYFLLILLGLWVFKVYFQNKRSKELLDKIPGPPTVPILGNLLMFNVPIEKTWNVIRDLNKNYYPIAKFWLGPYPYVSIHHPDDLEILLSSTKHLEKGSAYTVLHPWLRTGLLTSSGSKWQQRRKILTPAFHFKILKKYMEITNEHGKKFIEALRTENSETVQSLMPFCSNYTLHIICESAMGIALDKIDTKISKEYKNAVADIANLIMYRVMRPYLKEWMMLPVWTFGRLQTQTLRTLHKFTKTVLTERREYHKRSDNKYLKGFHDDTYDVNKDDVAIGGKKKLAMLDLLLSAAQDGLLDDEGIKEEVDTFMFAGHDTTGIALVYAIMLLAEHKEIQEKARAEVIEVLTESNGEIGTLEIQKLHYLERCIKESLRIFPPASALSRTVKEDIKLKNYVVPAGTEIGCHIFDLHRDPNFWPEPEKYDPDRFLPENIQGRHPYAYIPFSAGSRNCIGQKFAMMELKSLAARILYNFELEPVSQTKDMKLTLDLVTRPLEPVYTKFIRIDNNN